MSQDPYRFISRFYDALFERGARGLARVAVGVADLVPEGAVLDVGCGTGVLLEHALEQGHRAFGVDPSPAMLAVAHKRLQRRAFLHAALGQSMPYGDARFDATFATMVLHELPPDVRRATFREMVRVTRPSGAIVVADYHDGPLEGLWGGVNRVATSAAEVLAGRAHFAGYRHFKRTGCLPGLVSGEPVRIDTRKVVAGGNVAVHVLRRV